MLNEGVLVRSFVLLAMVVMSSPVSSAQVPITNVEKMPDGSIRVDRSNGKIKVIGAEKGQADISDIKISVDHRFAGWLVLRDGCCQSYPIALELRLFDGRKMRSVSDGMMQYRWCFVPGQDEVAVASGTTHGMNGERRTRYSVWTGKKLAEWYGESEDDAPAWSDCLGKMN